MQLFNRFSTIALIALVATIIMMITTTPFVDARRGSHDDRARDGTVTKIKSDEIELKNSLTSGTYKNTVVFRVRVDSSRIELRVTFKEQDTNTTSNATTNGQQEFTVRFDRGAEFIDTNNDFMYTPVGNTSDTTIANFAFGAWSNLSLSAADANGVQRITAHTLDNRYNLLVQFGTQPYNTTFANKTLQVTPNNIKFELNFNFTNYAYNSTNSRLAFRSKVESQFSAMRDQGKSVSSYRLFSGGDSGSGQNGGGSGGSGSGSGSGSGGSGSGSGGSGSGSGSGSNSTGGGSDDSGSDDHHSGKEGEGEVEVEHGAENETEKERENENERPESEIENESESEHAIAGRSDDNDSPNDKITRGIVVGNLNDTKAVLGVFDWLPQVVVDGQIVNLISSGFTRACDDEAAGSRCYRVWFAINQTRPREVQWDPTVGFGTAYLDASSGQNKVPQSSSANNARHVSFGLLTGLVMMVLAVIRL